MSRPWNVLPVDDALADRLARDLGVHPVTARLLIRRGIADSAAGGAYLNPSLQALRRPEGLAGFEVAVGRLARAATDSERVGIFGDYDVDGVTTTALLTLFLRELGVAVEPRVARRDGGYGFRVDHVEELAAAGVDLIITVDLGTKDLAAIAAAQSRGIDVVVIDHHQVPEGGEHPALALVNPHRADSAYPFRGFASVGLGFYLAAAVRTRLGRAMDVRPLLDLVAVGTLADRMPLVHENRILVKAGLRRLNGRARPGLAALLQRAGVDRGEPLDESHVGWKIAPYLNAPGRLGDARPALDLLLAQAPDEGDRWAEQCEAANLKRRSLQDRILDEALRAAEDRAGDPAIVVASDAWHPGVVGIVAAKIVERFHRPAVVIALDGKAGAGRGSVRTCDGIDVHGALDRCREHLVRYGGHAQAAGLTIETSRVDAFRTAFAEAVVASGSEGRGAILDVDAVVPLGEIDARLVGEIQRLAPFGPGNLEPVVVTPGARVRESRRVGDGSHLKLTLECQASGRSVPAIAFRMGDRDPGAGATVDLAFCPQLSYFRGTTRVELRVLDLRPAAPPPP